MKSLIVLSALLCVLLTGCAKSSSVTEIMADGTYSRTIKFTVSKSPGDDKAKWPESLVIPKNADWKTSETIKNDEKTTTLVRNGKLGDPTTTDIVGRDKGTTQFKNFVQITDLGDGKIKYYEKIVWVGNKDSDKETKVDEFAKALKATLPAGLLTDADAKVIAKKMEIKISRIFIGPDDQLLGMLMMNTDGAVLRLKNAVGETLNDSLTTMYGDKLSEEQRFSAIRSLYDQMDKLNVVDNDKMKSSPPSQEGDAGMIGMTTSVKLPGKVISHNGTYDRISGQVFWSMMSLAAQPETIEFIAICETSK